MPELGIVVGLVAVAAVYAVRVAPDVGLTRAVAFLTGIVVVALALVSPIDGVAHRRLWMHMVQHVLLISVAAPLLAAGRPFSKKVDRATRAWRWVSLAAVAQLLALLAWHVPALYDAALGHDPVHAAEHVTLLVTAVLLWMALDGLRDEQAGLALLVVFVVSFPPLLLGAAMTFARTVWYPAYARRGGLGDQQLAGVVMWAYGGLAAVAGGIALFVTWLARLEATNPSRVGVAPPC